MRESSGRHRAPNTALWAGLENVPEWGGGRAAALQSMPSSFKLPPRPLSVLLGPSSSQDYTLLQPRRQHCAWAGASLQRCPKAQEFMTSGNWHMWETVLRPTATFHFQYDFLSALSTVYCGQSHGGSVQTSLS